MVAFVYDGLGPGGDVVQKEGKVLVGGRDICHCILFRNGV